MKIDRANIRGINLANDLPDVSLGVQMFFQKIKIDLVRKENEDGYLKEKKKCLLTQGVRQTFTPAQLMMKPEGQRTWKWSKLHMTSESKLKFDDIAEIRNVKYRVMSVDSHAEYGVISYDLVEDYSHEE